MQSDRLETTASIQDRLRSRAAVKAKYKLNRDVEILTEAADEIARLQILRSEMLGALIEVSVFAEQMIDELCANIKGYGLDPISKMELARWQGVLNAINKASAA